MTHGVLLNTLNNEAHVYLAFADRHSDPKVLAWYREMLSAEESERHKSFYFTRDRNLYLLSHGLIRTALSRYGDIDPDKWVFTYDRYGRPEIAQSEGRCELRFSISRTHGLAACLVTRSIDVAVDVEEIRKFDNLETLSESVFTPFEISELRGSSGRDQMELFFTLWTLKEAYVKARGNGLALPLDRFSFYSDGQGCIHISVSPELQDIPSNWQFESYRTRGSHAVAVALDRKDRPDFRIRFLEAIPQLKELSFSCLRKCPSEDMERLPVGS